HRIEVLPEARRLLPDTVRGPGGGAGPDAAIDRLVEGGVQGRGLEGQAGGEIGDGVAAPAFLATDVVEGGVEKRGEVLGPGGPAQLDVDGAETARAQPLAGGQALVCVVEVVADLADAGIGEGHPLVEGPVPLPQLPVGGAVGLVRVD